MKDKATNVYRGASGELTGFRDEYRNHVMHTRKTYYEPEASTVLSKVRDFMTRMSPVLNENPKHAIKWSKV